MNCVQCDHALGGDDVFCPECGTEVSRVGTVPMGERTQADDGPTVSPQLDAIQAHLQEVVGDTYRIEKLLGRGGMGAVFLARERKLDRLVAIKVLPPGLSFDDQFTVRFVREARTAAQLDHPNIVPIYSVEDEGDLLFFVMKYVPGTDLTEEIRNNPLEIKRVQRLLWESACALGHAHQRGVVHRDVKPGNIMIDESGRPVLTDFGISKAATAETQFTATGQMIGTPTYMSPEQAKGLPVDGRTDQYALGVVGYQMLTGRVPFDDVSVHSLIYKQIFQDPEPLKSARRDCPDYLAEAIHRALQKEPKARFSTMEEFASAVWPENPVSAVTPPELQDISIHGEEGFTGTQETAILAGTARTRATRRWLTVGGTVAAAAVLAVGGWMMMAPEPAPEGAVVLAPTPPVSPVAESTVAAAAEPTATPPVEPTASSARAVPTEPPADRPPATTQVRPAAPAAPTTGFLNVGARPWGTVYLNGVELRNTPITNHELPVGAYVVEVRRVGYETVVDTVEITPGNPTRVNYVLIPGQQ